MEHALAAVGAIRAKLTICVLRAIAAIVAKIVSCVLACVQTADVASGGLTACPHRISRIRIRRRRRGCVKLKHPTEHALQVQLRHRHRRVDHFLWRFSFTTDGRTGPLVAFGVRFDVLPPRAWGTMNKQVPLPGRRALQPYTTR